MVKLTKPDDTYKGLPKIKSSTGTTTPNVGYVKPEQYNALRSEVERLRVELSRQKPERDISDLLDSIEILLAAAKPTMFYGGVVIPIEVYDTLLSRYEELKNG